MSTTDPTVAADRTDRGGGVAAVAAAVVAGIASVVVAVLARAAWLDRIRVEFAPSAAVVAVVWIVAIVLVVRWLRGRRGQLLSVLIPAGLTAVIGLVHLAFMGFGRPTYTDGSYSDVLTFVIAIGVASAVTLALAVTALVRRRPRP